MLVSLSGAWKSFGREHVLSGVDLEIRRGELVAVLGVNGAGKSTLLRVLAGLLGLDAGELLIRGKELDRFSHEQREELFFLPDFPALFEELTALQNIEVWMELYGKAGELRERAVIDLLDEFSLMEKSKQPTSFLSRGQRFKVALACYDAVRAPLGLFDEPFASGMDATGLKVMKRLIREAVGRGQAMVYSTQLVSYALDFSTRVLVIDGGDFYFDGSPDELRAKADEGDGVLCKFVETEE